MHVDLVMGVPGGMPGTADALVAAVAALPGGGDVLVGDRHRPLDARRGAGLACPRAATCGSGMEDVLTLAKGVPVEHNEQLVERAVGLAEIAQRPPMSTDEARELLQVKARRGR